MLATLLSKDRTAAVMVAIIIHAPPACEWWKSVYAAKAATTATPSATATADATAAADAAADDAHAAARAAGTLCASGNLPSYVEERSNAACVDQGAQAWQPNWTNQDNQFIIEKFDNRDINFYCVLDGHGENGHHVSKRCREIFPQYIFNLDMKRSFTIMQNDLNSCEFDVRCSGATCVLASLCGARLSVSNCGDSRAVLGRRNPNGSVTAHALTQDHKPDKPEERKRILACGGHLGCRQVLVNQPGRGPISMPVGPCRVWYQNRVSLLACNESSLGDIIGTADPRVGTLGPRG